MGMPKITLRWGIENKGYSDYQGQNIPDLAALGVLIVSSCHLVQHIYSPASGSRRIPDIKPYELQKMEKDECKISFHRFASLMSQHLDI